MAPAGKIRIAEEIVIEWLDRPAGATCPNCGRTGEVRQCLDIDFRPPDRPHRFILQICPACTVRFVDNTHSMDYGHEDVVELGWQAYQVQQGAGIWPIVGPLMRVPRGPGARVLEIGGGYGFGLDFCVRARGWRGEGYDPSLLSAFGRDELGLTVHQGYFGTEHLGLGPWDVLIATEVIEHVVIPPAFLRLARAALGETGILLLTTPDAEWIAPETSADRLLPLLSPGVHVVLQTQASLTQALHAAGFAHVRVAREGTSLIAYAAAAPFTLVDDPAATRASYRTYLIERALIAPPGSDLQLGFAGRGLFEAANDGDAAGAAAAWAALVPAVRARFGLDLETAESLPAGAADATLAALLALMPLNLGMVCFARAMDRLAAGVPRAAVARLLRLAGAAVAALQGALAKRSISDALYVVLGPLIADELLIGAAEAGAPDCVAPLAARGGALAWRGFVGLVNAAAYGPAAALRAAAGLDAPAARLDAGLQRDAWLSLAHLGLAPGGDVGLAVTAGAALGAAGAEILRQAFVRLVNAGDFAAARALAAARGLAAGAARHAEAGLAFAMLELGDGDPRAALDWLDRLSPPPAGAAGLRVQAFLRLVNAGRFEDAASLAASHDIARLAADDPVVARDAVLALMTLALAQGDPAASLAHLAALALPPAQRDELTVQAFIRLVNAGQFAAAQALAAAHDIARLAAGTPAAPDAALAETMLALAAGDPAVCLSRLADLALPPAQAAALTVQAFIRLVNAGRYAEAASLSARIGGLAAGGPPAAAADAEMAVATLDMVVGDPAAVLARLDALPGPARWRDALAVQGFIRLVNAGRYGEARALLAARDIDRLADDAEPALRRDAWLARIMLEMSAGDPGLIAGWLATLEVPAAAQDALRVQAFIRLVNAGRFDDAAALAGGRDMHRLAAGGAAAADAALATARFELQRGDPAALLARLDRLGLAPAAADEVAVQAFIRLVNAGRYAEARAVGIDGGVLERAARCAAGARADARRAAVMLELAVGDPVAAAEQVEGLGLEAAEAASILAQAFIRLVNAGRFAAAAALATAHDVRARAAPLPVAADVRRAEISLALNTGDPAGALALLEGGGLGDDERRAIAGQIVLRLVNEARFAAAALVVAAHGVAGDEPALGRALALIELHEGEPARVPALVAASGLDQAAAQRLCLAAFTRLVGTGRFAAAQALLTPPLAAALAAAPGEDAQAARLAAVLLDLGLGRTEAAMQRLDALREAGVPAATLGPLAVEGFVRLVNEARDAPAAALWPGAAEWLFACPAALRHDALAARVVLALRGGEDPFMALEAAAAGGLAPARLEALALAGLVALVNRADYGAARRLLARAEPALIRAAPPLDEAVASAMFAAGLLFLQDRRDWRRAAALLARLREALIRRTPPGGTADPLFWPALRAEIIALQGLARGAEAASLLKSLIPVYPACPEDLRAQVGAVG
jgi:hypothetical protein